MCGTHVLIEWNKEVLDLLIRESSFFCVESSSYMLISFCGSFSNTITPRLVSFGGRGWGGGGVGGEAAS